MTLIFLSAIGMALPWLMIIFMPLITLFAAFGMISFVVVRMVEVALAEPVKIAIVKSKVLVVDDDYASVLPLLGALENLRVDVQFVSSGIEMLNKLKDIAFDYVILDREMPWMTGEESLELGEHILRLRRPQPVVFYSGINEIFAVPMGLRQFDICGVWNKYELDRLQQKLLSLFEQLPTRVA